jgi:hypothetical protein
LRVESFLVIYKLSGKKPRSRKMRILDPAEGHASRKGSISVASRLNNSRSAHKREKKLHHSKVCYDQSTILMFVTIWPETTPSPSPL